jgi:hypothetical protein
MRARKPTATGYENPYGVGQPVGRNQFARTPEPPDAFDPFERDSFKTLHNVVKGIVGDLRTKDHRPRGVVTPLRPTPHPVTGGEDKLNLGRRK